jgi:hypothetical protein
MGLCLQCEQPDAYLGVKPSITEFRMTPVLYPYVLHGVFIQDFIGLLLPPSVK